MRKLSFLVIGIALVGLTRTASAQMPYSMGGCGLGSILIKDRGQWEQAGVAFLNNFFFPQTFAITSGTSNCSDVPKKTAQMEQEVYVTANLGNLTKEAAQGNGEHLTGLAEVLGCENVDLGGFSRENYETLFSDSEPKTVLESYKKQLKSSPEYARACSRLG